MTTTKTTPSEQTGIKLTELEERLDQIEKELIELFDDPLVDRDCAVLDGNCNCKIPWKDCKYLKEG